MGRKDVKKEKIKVPRLILTRYILFVLRIIEIIAEDINCYVILSNTANSFS